MVCLRRHPLPPVFRNNRLVSLGEYRRNLSTYMGNKMAVVAPNLGALIGDSVAARLISHAGSLTNLAKVGCLAAYMSCVTMREKERGEGGREGDRKRNHAISMTKVQCTVDWNWSSTLSNFRKGPCFLMYTGLSCGLVW